MGLWQFIMLAFWAAVILIPVVRILDRTGFSKWLAVIAIIPLVNLIGLWAFAFMRWPTDDSVKTMD